MWLSERTKEILRSDSGMVVLLVLVLCSVAASAISSSQALPAALPNGGLLKGLRSTGDTASPVSKLHHHGGSRRKHRRHLSRLRAALHDPDSASLAANPHPSRRRSSSNDDSHSEVDRKSTDNCNPSFASFTADNRTSLQTLEEVDSLLCRYYGPWSRWRPCNRKCHQSRVRRCRVAEQCGVTKLKEHRTCQRKRGRCSSRVSYHHLHQATDSLGKRNRLIQRVLYDVLYTSWSSWGSCTRSCRQRRRRRCTVREVCRNSYIQDSRRCSVPGTKCQRRNAAKPSGGENEEDTHTVEQLSSSSFSPAPSSSVSTAAEETTHTKGKSRPKADRTKKKEKQKKEERGQPTTGDWDDVLVATRDTCGRRPPATSGSYRVVGGQEAQRLSWPWQMAILTRWEEQYCAGTLIAPQWVLTAAHCVRKKNRRRRIIVRAGEHDLGMFEGSEDDIRPDKEFPHPDFDYATITNDIALVRLKTPLEKRSHPGYACLPGPDFSPDRGSLCYILGWGKLRNTHIYGAETLHEAEVPLVNSRRCQKVFEYDINNATQLCAGYRRGGTDACAGDSGGPLLCPRTTGGVTRWYLTGITSYGEGCGRRGKYGIYTNVTSYLPWIAETMRSF